MFLLTVGISHNVYLFLTLAFNTMFPLAVNFVFSLLTDGDPLRFFFLLTNGYQLLFSSLSTSFFLLLNAGSFMDASNKRFSFFVSESCHTTVVSNEAAGPSKKNPLLEGSSKEMHRT